MSANSLAILRAHLLPQQARQAQQSRWRAQQFQSKDLEAWGIATVRFLDRILPLLLSAWSNQNL